MILYDMILFSAIRFPPDGSVHISNIKTKERLCLADKDIEGRKTYCQVHLKGISW